MRFVSTAFVMIATSEPWAALSLWAAYFRPSVHTGANECGSFAPVLFRLSLHHVRGFLLLLCIGGDRTRRQVRRWSVGHHAPGKTAL